MKNRKLEQQVINNLKNQNSIDEVRLIKLVEKLKEINSTDQDIVNEIT